MDEVASPHVDADMAEPVEKDEVAGLELVAGDCGSNVTSLADQWLPPSIMMTVHCVADGHATALSEALGSISVRGGVPMA